MDLSLVCCAISHHLTNAYGDSYNETHESIGVVIEESYDRHTYGLQGFHFNDSFDKSSFLASGNYLYSVFKYLKAGAGAGWVRTSYYNGAIILPIAEIGTDAVSVQLSAFPQAFGSEALVMGQIKLKLYEVK